MLIKSAVFRALNFVNCSTLHSHMCALLFMLSQQLLLPQLQSSDSYTVTTTIQITFFEINSWLHSDMYDCDHNHNSNELASCCNPMKVPMKVPMKGKHCVASYTGHADNRFMSFMKCFSIEMFYYLLLNPFYIIRKYSHVVS